MRYTDEKKNVDGPADFVVRTRKPTLYHLSVMLAAAFMVSVVLSLVVAPNYWLMVILLFALLSALGWYCVMSLLRDRDMLLATEFQNALFASALGMNNRFCLIIKRDGSIVYFDRLFQQMFPNFMRKPRRAVDVMLEEGQVSRADSEKIFSAIERGVFDKVLFSMRSTDDGGFTKIIMTIEPILRPSGFLLLRGRDFVEQRAEGEEHQEETLEILPRASTNIFSSFLDIMNLGGYVAGPRGTIVFVSPILERWLGYQTGEVASRNLHLPQLLHAEGDSNSEPASFQGEVNFRHKSGAAVKVLLNQQLIHDDAGRMLGCAAVVQQLGRGSVDEKKELVMLGNSENSGALEQFIRLSPIPIVKLDETGSILDGNLAFHALTQQAFADKKGVRLLELAGGAKQAETESLIEKLLAGEEVPSPFAMELQLPGGTGVMISAYASLLPEGRKKHWLLHLIDTTEQKNLELRFAHSQKMQAVGQLAGGIAHDFNNLLTAMIGFCDLLLMRHPAGDQSFADIMQIKQNANRAANLVRQLLAFSRRQTLQPKMLDITDVLAELSNLIRRLIGENIELKVIHGRDMGMVKADQGQLEQVLINLAVNARDAMKNGGVLTIRTDKAKIDKQHMLKNGLIAPSEEDAKIPDGEYVRVEVIDTGHGIPAFLTQKIFEPFFSTKEVGSGTGLGLATCYGIIKQTGGYIFVSSEENKGTTFTLLFPSHAPLPHDPAAEQDAGEKSVNVDLTGKSTVLLVEDETPVRIFAARALRNKGYTVLEADCGETGLEVMKEHGHEIEVIITDVIMPGINGPAMIEQISQEYPEVKVVFMSGYAEDIFVSSYGSERSFNFLAKPFTLKQLASKIKDVTMGK